MPFAAVNGRRAYYHSPRPLAEGPAKGKTIVLIHEATGNHTSWLPQIQSLGAEHTPMAIDLPGHGQSEGPGCTRVSEYLEFFEELIDTLGLSDFVVAGHSMGGSIALEYTLRHPEKIQGLVLIGSGARWGIPKTRMEVWRTDPEMARRETARRNFSATTPRSIVELFISRYSSTPPAVAAGDIEACNTFDVVSRLPEIRTPTLIICGVEDGYAEESRLLASHITGSRLEWIKGASHVPLMEQPVKTNDLIRGFLDGLT